MGNGLKQMKRNGGFQSTKYIKSDYGKMLIRRLSKGLLV